MTNHKKDLNAQKNQTIRTPLASHTRRGKNLLPPFAMMKNRLSLCSWMNDRLPEMLWAALILAAFPRKDALTILSKILKFILHHKHSNTMNDLTLTGISKIPVSIREELLEYLVITSNGTKSLWPLLLYDDLPGKEAWSKFIPDCDQDISLLIKAVGYCLDHQSQESTDCRWVRLMGQVVGGKLHVPEEQLKQWCEYPDSLAQQSIMPSIRAAEACPMPFMEINSSWPESFWHQSWKATPCFGVEPEQEKCQNDIQAEIASIINVHDKLHLHWNNTHSTTAIDAKHDAIFGIAFYSLLILEELTEGITASGITGRLALRTLLELRICLHFLTNESSDELWHKWRAYGTGQAKLNALRFENSTPPNYISQESLAEIANEDLWQEFVTINIGSWHALDLRKVSERIGLKDEYDAYYSWSSGYVHGTWGAIREACFSTCENPLHRLHRCLNNQPLRTTFFDAALLVDKILADLDTCYPGFEWRINPNSSPLEAPE